MTQSYYNPSVGLGMGTSGSEANRYGAYQHVAEAARNRQREGLGSARRDMAYQIAGMTSAGANPFGAARAADRAYQAQAGDIRQQASEQMQQAAAMEAQRREEEMLRKQQEARQFLGAGLSTAGAVLGTVVGGPIGAQAGGGLGSMVGGGLTGVGGQPGAARPMAGQQAAQQQMKPAMGMSPANVYGAPQQAPQQAGPSMGLAPPSMSGPTGLRSGPNLGGFAGMLNPFSMLGSR